MGNCECFENSKELEEITKYKKKTITKRVSIKSSRVNFIRIMKRPEKLDDSLKSLLYEKFELMKEKPKFVEVSKEEFDSVLKKNKFYKKIIQNFKIDILSMRFEKDAEYENVAPIKVFKEGDEEGEEQYYQGCYNNEGKCHGYGIWTKKGNIYLGNFKYDVFSGNGLYINEDGNCYFGEWDKGKCNGKGQLIKNDNVAYEGNYKNNLKEGKGVENFSDGGIYVGNFNDNEKNGNGKYIFPDGSIFEGEFEKSKCKSGVIKWNDGKKYKGKFNNGKIEGKGEYFYKNGIIFSGEFKDNYKHGFGEYEWPDGKIFQGKWVNNQPDGEGIFIDPTNKINELIHYKDGKIEEK